MRCYLTLKVLIEGEVLDKSAISKIQNDMGVEQIRLFVVRDILWVFLLIVGSLICTCKPARK